MVTLHIMHERQGWVVKQSPDEAACLIISQKTEAISIARRWADRYPESRILLYKEEGRAPLPLENVRRRRRSILLSRAAGQ
jgi:hypothetical protein